MARGQTRMYMQRIEKDTYSEMNTIQSATASQADAARKQLRQEMQAIAPLYTHKHNYLSDDIRLEESYLSP
ncbi:stringent starvation protein A, partial [Klebsiella pneumoniae]|nr:stringent starvation protein A [Klebsiella pneumoniae]